MIGRKHLPGEGRKELDYKSNILIFFCGDWPVTGFCLACIWALTGKISGQENWDKDGDINSHASTHITPPEWMGKILQIITSHWGEKELDYVSRVPTFMGTEVLACFACLGALRDPLYFRCLGVTRNKGKDLDQYTVTYQRSCTSSG